jgi:hypothetical protein
MGRPATHMHNLKPVLSGSTFNRLPFFVIGDLGREKPGTRSTIPAIE